MAADPIDHNPLPWVCPLCGRGLAPTPVQPYARNPSADAAPPAGVVGITFGHVATYNPRN